MPLHSSYVATLDSLLHRPRHHLSIPFSTHSTRPSRALRLLRHVATAAPAHPNPQQSLQHDLPPYQPPSSSPSSSPPPPTPTPLTIHPSPLLPPKTIKPFSAFLTDTFARQHTYLRISITERCNLRCTYCMPAAGVPLSPTRQLLTTPEIVHLAGVFVKQGVNKIRLTGGEPTVRKDIVGLVQRLGELRGASSTTAAAVGDGGGGGGLKELCITSNGLVLGRKLEAMIEAGLTGVNLSLDTLDPWQFQIMTRRSGFEAVMGCMARILELKKRGAMVKLKINVVVMRGVNDGEMMGRFVELGREKDVEVRFIEYMPFEGNRWERRKVVGYREMVGVIRERFPGLERVVEGPNETSKTYQVPGFEGKVGFITSMTDDFCGGCNRLRITSDGNLKVCLFGNAEVSLRDLLRKENGGEPINEEAMEAMKNLETDARQGLVNGAAGGINGYAEREQELLEVIGMAVKRKKAKHAGMGKLENMKNRPMILIDDAVTSSTLMQIRKSLDAESLKMSDHRGTPSSLRFGALYKPSMTSMPHHLEHHLTSSTQLRTFSASHRPSTRKDSPALPHLTSQSTIHQTSVTAKPITHRSAVAIGHIRFSTPETLPVVRTHLLAKGDVLAVARVGAISAMKETARLVILCHSGVGVEGAKVEAEAVDAIDQASEMGHMVERMDARGEMRSGVLEEEVVGEEEKVKRAMMLDQPIGDYGGVRLAVRVETTAKTGIEMEALTGVMGAALNVVDMVKGIDKAVVIEKVKIVGKKGGRSGGWGLWSGEEAYGGHNTRIEGQ